MQKTLPEELDEERFTAILYSIEKHPTRPHSARVENILELLSGLRDDLNQHEKVRASTRLRMALGRYRWTIQIATTPDAGYIELRVPAPEDPMNFSSDDKWEYESVRSLLDAVPRLGARPRIRRCEFEGCRKWLFAGKRADQRFCLGGTCKQKSFESDPTKKEKKLAQMREAYAVQKRRDKKAKERIGFTGSATLKILRAMKPLKKSR